MTLGPGITIVLYVSTVDSQSRTRCTYTLYRLQIWSRENIEQEIQEEKSGYESQFLGMNLATMSEPI